ncbi:methylated-DNA--[protein]-cysteine S-methyltransferase [Streptomyces yaizuensis]|uniref:Methylated-DNA--[protein]-cysteine S-methyltransferase n=1 Tax=Streptomyces yaizuensis TaxID=2989713 RepID=A0ABQ5P5E5_9ACTN|nr:methylated-DNA--[protein]-cysteine S-methyltransferase [Streptomyces sp. YSPA8]GLF97762.1 methylated-DNA--[protein]-cysteine S-methyltransferase [Streptomyces sp. YSPA8]
MTLYTTVDSPLGELLLVGERSGTAKDGIVLASLSLPGQKGGAVVQDGWRRDDAAFTGTADQLQAYFSGATDRFDIEHTTRGTDFQRRVWAALDAIPHGTTTSYKHIAEQAGSPAAVRAVGTAIGANPLLIVRPCHRVIGSNGALGGYAGGVAAKQRLLTHEGAAPMA